MDFFPILGSICQKQDWWQAEWLEYRPKNDWTPQNSLELPIMYEEGRNYSSSNSDQRTWQKTSRYIGENKRCGFWMMYIELYWDRDKPYKRVYYDIFDICTKCGRLTKCKFRSKVGCRDSLWHKRLCVFTIDRSARLKLDMNYMSPGHVILNWCWPYRCSTMVEIRPNKLAMPLSWSRKRRRLEHKSRTHLDICSCTLKNESRIDIFVRWQWLVGWQWTMSPLIGTGHCLLLWFVMQNETAPSRGPHFGLCEGQLLQLSHLLVYMVVRTVEFYQQRRAEDGIIWK